ncbi:ribonucleoside-triphosphate reductase [Streptomyces nanshensis]|nr:ribonucleoside-triphosphate reductase [Streptomyces nanshensis]
MTNNTINWGPTGETVFNRTYSRTKADGSGETWPETVERVVDGNLGLVDKKYHLKGERENLIRLITDFGILPAGRHLWASGVEGRQFLFNCWHSGWDKQDVTKHFTFTFLRLMEGGGVGANYATKKVIQYGAPLAFSDIRIICDPRHEDYQAMVDEGLIDTEFDPNDFRNEEVRANVVHVRDSREGWASALEDLINHAWQEDYLFDADYPGYFDVSQVRHAGSPLRQFGGTASGPAPLARMLLSVAGILNGLHSSQSPMGPLEAMEIDHAIAQCVVAGGVRRSARMSIVPWDDPHIDDFLVCKQDSSKHWTTNISVAVDDEFYYRLDRQDDRAWDILRRISKGMLENGEPGIWNRSYSQEGEHGVVDSTNPCGEIPLEEWEACNLGHINLDAFAPKNVSDSFDMWGAKHAARLVTRFLIRATFGDITDYNSRRIMDTNRRIGVGITGFQSALAKMGISYSEAWNEDEVAWVLETLKRTVDDEAFSYAKRLRIPSPIKTTTVAPTGTISKLAGVTEGIHPIYARYFIRRIRFSMLRPNEVLQTQQYQEQGYHVEPDQYSRNTMVVSIPTKELLVDQVTALGYDESIVEAADEISLTNMLTVQHLVQKHWADNAVSFTANIDPDHDAEDLALVLYAYGQGVKGTTVMPRNESRPQMPYEAISKEAYEEYAAKQVSDSVDESCTTGACPIK